MPGESAPRCAGGTQRNHPSTGPVMIAGEKEVLPCGGAFGYGGGDVTVVGQYTPADDASATVCSAVDRGD